MHQELSDKELLLHEISTEAKELHQMIKMSGKEFLTYFAHAKDKDEVVLKIIDNLDLLAAQLRSML